MSSSCPGNVNSDSIVHNPLVDQYQHVLLQDYDFASTYRLTTVHVTLSFQFMVLVDLCQGYLAGHVAFHHPKTWESQPVL